MSEKKREYYIRSLEEILESEWTKISHEAYFTEGAIKDLLELLKGEPEPKPISYMECANAMLKMWIDNVLTDGEYNRIMDKLNSKHMEDMRGEQREEK